MKEFMSWLLRIKSPSDDVRRRGQVLVTIAGTMIVVLLLALPLVFMLSAPALGVAAWATGVVTYSIVLLLARRGYVTAGGVVLLGIMLAITLGLLTDRAQSLDVLYFLTVPLLAGALVLRPAYLWVILALTLAAMFAILWLLPSAPFADPKQTQTIFSAALVLVITTLLSFLGGRATQQALANASHARDAAQSAAAELEQANAALEERVAGRTAALQQALAEVEARAVEQARLLAENDEQRTVIRELSVPVLPLNNRTLVMPLVGALDSTRLMMVQERALEAIQREAARQLLLDITGVAVVDSQVAIGLLAVVQAARLLGAEVVLVGVRPEVAQATVGLGLDLRGMRAFGDLRTALSTLATAPLKH